MRGVTEAQRASTSGGPRKPVLVSLRAPGDGIVASSASSCATLTELLQLRASEQPDLVAYRFLADGENESDSRTYVDIDARARSIGAELRLHASPGEPVLLLLPPGLEFVDAFFGCLMDAAAIAQPLGRPRTRPKRLGGDEGYSYERIRRWLRAHRVEAVIPQRDDQRESHKGRPLRFDKRQYRRRSIIEQCIGWLKECRRVCTRYEKLAVNFLAMLKLAIIQRYLRKAFSNRA